MGARNIPNATRHRKFTHFTTVGSTLQLFPLFSLHRQSNLTPNQISPTPRQVSFCLLIRQLIYPRGLLSTRRTNFHVRFQQGSSDAPTAADRLRTCTVYLIIGWPSDTLCACCAGASSNTRGSPTTICGWMDARTAGFMQDAAHASRQRTNRLFAYSPMWSFPKRAPNSHPASNPREFSKWPRFGVSPTPNLCPMRPHLPTPNPIGSSASGTKLEGEHSRPCNRSGAWQHHARR